MSPHLIGQYLLLRLIPVFEELLNNIIAENIGHQLNRIWIQLSEDLVFFVAVGRLKLLLNEP